MKTYPLLLLLRSLLLLAAAADSAAARNICGDHSNSGKSHVLGLYVT
jgi:hypothetical protein